MDRTSWQLTPFFTPQTIAVVGASPLGGAGSIVLHNLERIGFTGDVIPINPKYAQVADKRCYASLETVPAHVQIDCVAVLLGSARLMPILESAVARGVKGVWAFASGFAETGQEGATMQQTLRDFCRIHALAFCGPNCVGYVNCIDHVCMYSAPLPKHFHKGSIGVIAQSGAVLLALGNSDREAGFSRLISSGNEAVLDTVDYLNYLVDDPATSVIALFLESIRDTEAFAQACLCAARAGKPLVVLKVGRSALAQKVASTHTGGIAGQDKTLDIFFRRYGLMRVNTLDELLETTMLFATLGERLPASPRLVMSTVSGGEMGMLVDVCADHGFTFPPLSSQAIQSLSEVLPPYAPLANPLDAWGSGDLSTAYPACLNILAAESLADTLLISQDMPANMAPGQIAQCQQVAQAAVATRNKTHKPVVVLSNSVGGLEPSLCRILQQGHVPLMQGSAQGLNALALAARYAAFRADFLQNAQATPTPPLILPPQVHTQVLACNGMAPYALCRALLESAGLVVGPEFLVNTEKEALVAASRLGWPVTLKGLVRGIAHKTESGLVQLNIADEKALRIAWDALSTSIRLHHPQAFLEGILVQPMVCNAVAETLVGVNRAASETPESVHQAVIVLGLGGIFVELLDDFAMDLTPLSLERAEKMVRQLKGARLLNGFRNRPQADVQALAATLVKIARLAESLGNHLVSLDLNPLMVLPHGHGVRVVDMVLHLKTPGRHV